MDFVNPELQRRLNRLLAEQPSYEHDDRTVLELELADFDGPLLPEGTIPNQMIVSGRNGAGKSIFEKNFRGSPLFMGMHCFLVDSDDMKRKTMEALKQGQLAIESAYIMALSYGTYPDIVAGVGIPLVSISAGVDVVIPPSLPPFLSEDRALYPVPLVHVLHCTQDVAMARVQKRMEEGGHPYDPSAPEILAMKLTGPANLFGLFMAMKYADKAVLWDTNMDEQMVPILVLSRQSEQYTADIYHPDRVKQYGFNRDNIAEALSYIVAGEETAGILLSHGGILGNPFVKKETVDKSHPEIAAGTDKFPIGSLRQIAGGIGRYIEGRIPEYEELPEDLREQLDSARERISIRDVLPEQHIFPTINPLSPWREQMKVGAPNYSSPGFVPRVA